MGLRVIYNESNDFTILYRVAAALALALALAVAGAEARHFHLFIDFGMIIGHVLQTVSYEEELKPFRIRAIIENLSTEAQQLDQIVFLKNELDRQSVLI